MNPSESIEKVIQPGAFCIRQNFRFRIVKLPEETVAWEIYRGHLLEPNQTDHELTFVSWNVLAAAPEQIEIAPLVSVRWHEATEMVYVTRNLLVYGWETYDDDQGMIQTRPAKKFRAELVSSIALKDVDSQEQLETELSTAVQQAVVGVSRLPITSVESPLPAYSLGDFTFLPNATIQDEPIRAVTELIETFQRSHSKEELARRWEFVLRATNEDEIQRVISKLWQAWQKLNLQNHEISAVARCLFQQISLSPHTQVVNHFISCLTAWSTEEKLGEQRVIDLLSLMIRLLVRHLTAFDLVKFHSFGANYPDAFALDSLLKALLSFANDQPNYFRSEPTDSVKLQSKKQLRRRAIRQGWMIRKQLTGYLVPDTPTSQGENIRVLPDSFPHVPEEQITQPTKRRKSLFEDAPSEALLNPSTREILTESLRDLTHQKELLELGTGIYLDRPLGLFKPNGSVDRTPLLSYVAMSRSIAEQRLMLWKQWKLIDEVMWQELTQQLKASPPDGIPVIDFPDPARGSAVSLEDAKNAALDFHFIHTTSSSLKAFWELFNVDCLQTIAPKLAKNISTLSANSTSHNWLLIRAANARQKLLESLENLSQASVPLLELYDKQLRLRLQLAMPKEFDSTVDYIESQGMENLRCGLEITKLFEVDERGELQELSLPTTSPRIYPR